MVSYIPVITLITSGNSTVLVTNVTKPTNKDITILNIRINDINNYYCFLNVVLISNGYLGRLKYNQDSEHECYYIFLMV